MSDWERFCPRCETAIAKWNFDAPPDFYRCFVCLYAIPFKDLPRRNVLRSWTGPPPRVLRIPRGTAGTVLEFGVASVTIENVTCGAGSTLVVGAAFNAQNPDPEATSFSFTWNGQSSTQAVFRATGSGQSAGIAYLIANESGTHNLEVVPNTAQEIAAFASELPSPASPVQDTSGSVGTTLGEYTMSCTQPMSSSPQLAITVVGTSSLSSYDDPFSDGQQIALGLSVGEEYALLAGGTASAHHSGAGTIQVSCIATFGVSP